MLTLHNILNHNQSIIKKLSLQNRAHSINRMPLKCVFCQFLFINFVTSNILLNYKEKLDIYTNQLELLFLLGCGTRRSLEHGVAKCKCLFNLINFAIDFHFGKGFFFLHSFKVLTRFHSIFVRVFFASQLFSWEKFWTVHSRIAKLQKINVSVFEWDNRKN